jgi:HSP20 family protein
MLTELTKTEPRMKPRFFDLFQSMTPDLDMDFLPQLFGRAYKFGLTSNWMPKMDVFEHEGELVFKADLPGVKKEDITVTVEESNYLVIQGERKEEKETKDKGYYRNEVDYGSFYRRFSLAFKADSGLIKATYKDGILEVRVPILAETKPETAKVAVS